MANFPAEILSDLMPLRIPEGPDLGTLQDLAAEVLVQAKDLGRGLPEALCRDLRSLIAIVNTSASNLIEGHDTRPAAIIKAYNEKQMRSQGALLDEALANFLLQEQINRQAVVGELPHVPTLELLTHIHRAFFEQTKELLEVSVDGGPIYTALPGKLRGDGMDVVVGQHVPPLGRHVDTLCEALCMYYEKHSTGTARRVLDVATFHHRLLYLHPFAEGNGRTVRLASHAHLHSVGAGGSGLWSISRGLMRGRDGSVEERQRYKLLLANADKRRQGTSTDGRGALTERGLSEFATWFLEVALDQIAFMALLYEFDSLQERVTARAHAQLNSSRLVEQALPLLRALLREGEMPRNQAWPIIGGSDRTGRDVVKKMMEAELIQSDSERGELRLQAWSSELFPQLF